jgi:regulator of cell morphogenesis and NO signaling
MATTVGEMVRQNPRLAELFTRVGIDFCCNGHDLLDEAARKANVDTELVKKQIEELSVAEKAENFNYDGMSLSQLIDHILSYHHEYIYKSSEYILSVLNKVYDRHGANHPELAQIKYLTESILGELPIHQHKEEMILFPYIKSLDGGQISNDSCFGTVANPIAAMESDHVATGKMLFSIRDLSDNFTPPADACTSFELLYKLLKALFENIQQHIHLENNLLHPKAIAREKSLKKKG